MKLPRRKFLHLAAGAATLPALPRVARAQAYPARPVRIIVGFPAGGSADLATRLVGQWLSERLKQQFVVENRPGAGANIAVEAVVNAAADGYTLLLVGPPQAINATLYEKLNFNFLRDITPIASILRSPPDSVAAIWLRRWPSLGNISSTRSIPDLSFWLIAPSNKFSRTVKRSKMAFSCGTYPRPRRTRR